MLAQTVADNSTIVNCYSNNIFTKDTCRLMEKSIKKIVPNLERLDNKNKNAGPATEKDLEKIVKWAIKEDEPFDELLDRTIHASSSMLTLASQLKGARVLFRNPKEFSKNVSSEDGSHKGFQKKGKLPEMVAWIASGLKKTNKTSRRSLSAQLKSISRKRRHESTSSNTTSDASSDSSDEDKKKRKRRQSRTKLSLRKKSKKTKTSSSSTVSSSDEVEEPKTKSKKS